MSEAPDPGGGGAGAFARAWSAEVLTHPPLIAPARSFTYPREVAGEEDALARGALRLLVRPEGAAPFLATCALGFTNTAMPTGVFACPDARELCAVAGGYAYIIDTLEPARSTHLALKPVVAVVPVPGQDLLLFAGFHALAAWSRDGLAWTSARLSWEGVRLGEIEGTTLHGWGWDLLRDREVPFDLDLRTGEHTGGGFTQTVR